MADDVAAAEAFGVLSDPTRIAILRTFAQALEESGLGEGSMPVLSFSTVYDRVDVDSTSRLSYHLEELDGHFLRRTDDGWTFTFAGEAIVRMVLSGAYAGGISREPIETGTPCPVCEAAAIQVVVEDLALFRECQECGRRMGGIPVTPAQVQGRDDEALLDSARTRMVSGFWRFRENVCTECGGGVDVDFRDLGDGAGRFEWIAVGRCRQCRRSWNGPPSLWCATHPATVAFHWERSVDVREIGMPEMNERLAAGEWETTQIGPDEYEITYRVEDAELRLRVDDDMTVRATERVRRDSFDDA